MINFLRNLILGRNRSVSSPKLLLERKDTSLAIFCSILRRLRAEKNAPGNDDIVNHSLVEEAVSILESRLHDESPPEKFRAELQDEYEPQVLRLFEAFLEVDERIFGQARSDFLRDQFQNEFDICHQLMKGEDIEFFKRKHEALKSIDQQNDLYRIRNVVQQKLLREKFGYNTVTFESTISHPKAGNGLFVEGTAPIGSILAFLPGEVWLAEFLKDGKYMSNFQSDLNLQLTLRPDDNIIDARSYDTLESKVPYFVPSIKGENPWSGGHLVNHSSGESANCLSIMINYSQEMDKPLRSFVPHSFAVQPSLMGRSNIDHCYFMYGMAFIAIKDISNQEVFCDYRLKAGANCPDWYSKSESS